MVNIKRSVNLNEQRFPAGAACSFPFLAKARDLKRLFLERRSIFAKSGVNCLGFDIDRHHKPGVVYVNMYLDAVPSIFPGGAHA